MVEIKEGLTFDDVLLVPKKSAVASRKDITLRTKLTRNICINVPLVSANMDTVTEAAMAVAMARQGGIGIIHRFLTIEQQVAEILKVKRAEGLIIERPYTITPEKSIKAAREMMEDVAVTGLLVVDHSNKLVGILTHKDMKFQSENSKKVEEIMTGKADLITAPVGISQEDAKKIMIKNKIEKLPITDQDGYLRGLITSKDVENREKYPMACKDSKGRLIVGAAVGVKEGFLERADALLKAGCDVLVVDIAHGHSDLGIDTVKAIKNNIGSHAEVIAGNVATAAGTKDLIDAGADCIKVGVGPGSTCITRIVTGSGVPQLMAVVDCAKVGMEYNIPLIADGGLKNSGDVVKALAAGAHSVMSGSFFAGTDESPGNLITKDGRKFKAYRGMASLGATVGRRLREKKEELTIFDIVPEGVEATVPYKGSITELIPQLVGGIRSGFSYCGARNIDELHKNAEFIRMTSAGMKESKPHILDLG